MHCAALPRTRDRSRLTSSKHFRFLLGAGFIAFHNDLCSFFLKTTVDRGILLFMKKRIIALCSIVILLMIVTLSVGCESGISAGKSYYLYTYDTRTDRFVRKGPSLKFTDGLKGFEFSYGTGDLTISGRVNHTKRPDSYIVSCNEEVIAVVNERYKQSLIAAGADQETIDFYEAVAENFSAESQYFSYNGKLFLGSAIELYHLPDKSSDSFEGYYYIESSDDPVRLLGGYLYTKDDSGNYTVKSGSYTVSNGILTLISLNDRGQPLYQNGMLYRKRYLMAKVTIPTGGSLVGTSMEDQLNTSAFVKKVSEDMEHYSGKTVAVLCEQFFAQKM